MLFGNFCQHHMPVLTHFNLLCLSRLCIFLPFFLKQMHSTSGSPQAFMMNRETSWLWPHWQKNSPQRVKFLFAVVSVDHRASDRKDVSPIFDITTDERRFCCNLNGLCDDPGLSQTGQTWPSVKTCLFIFYFLFSPFSQKYPRNNTQECLWGCGFFLKLL